MHGRLAPSDRGANGTGVTGLTRGMFAARWAPLRAGGLLARLKAKSRGVRRDMTVAWITTGCHGDADLRRSMAEAGDGQNAAQPNEFQTALVGVRLRKLRLRYSMPGGTVLARAFERRDPSKSFERKELE